MTITAKPDVKIEAAAPAVKAMPKATEKPPVASKAVKAPKAASSVMKKTDTPKTRAAKPVAAKPAVTQLALATKAAKPEKQKKPKLVRDSFTIPKDEYELLAQLKARAINLKKPAKKSEVLRAGIKLLASLKDGEFLSALSNVPLLKTGRPASTKGA
jgi:hypothetical protein